MMVAEDCESHQRWLCFPATKSTQVKHVTGYSIEHGDAIAATLHAFSHYTLVSSSSDFDTATDHDSLFSEPDERVASVCTDICYFLGDDGIPIVFDTITHSDTLPGEAWRDLGADGVENFQRKHVCNQVCVDLELKDMKIVA
ncbi:hypothetical protein PLICRDRAFT_40359 [Plicaturopsis crispa FD-325 SS-3]|nr:hypothetical protein PLICRDRAFT_40359 [Plicaturopsis crispa FD-325 SS-3]